MFCEKCLVPLLVCPCCREPIEMVTKAPKVIDALMEKYLNMAMPGALEDFKRITGASEVSAMKTVLGAFRLGLTMDHAVEYYLTGNYIN
jgi:hypothetical protein